MSFPITFSNYIMMMGREELLKYIKDNNPLYQGQKLFQIINKHGNVLRYIAFNSTPSAWTKHIVADLPRHLRQYFVEHKIKRCMNILNETYDVSHFQSYINPTLTSHVNSFPHELAIDKIMLIISTSRVKLSVTGFIRNIKNIQHTVPAELICMCVGYFYVESLNSLLMRESTLCHPSNVYVPKSEKFEVEKNIMWHICTKYPQEIDLLEKILTRGSWIIEINNFPQFRNDIIQYIDTCARFDYECALKLFTEHCDYEEKDITTISDRNDEIIGFINTAAKYGSYKCISFLLQKVHVIDWTKHRKLICLYNAVKYNHDRLEFIDFIVTRLQLVKNIFTFGISDEIMKEVIKSDLVTIAQKIIGNKWHTVSTNDELQAQLVNGKCHQFFIEKSDVMNYYQNYSNVEELDLDEWTNEDGEESEWDVN
eukprot:236686_1